MRPKAIDSILDQIRNLDPDERVLIADKVDRLTWRDQVEALLSAVQTNCAQDALPSDDEIDRLVRDVRSEKPLFERYWARRRRSAR